MTDIAFYHLTSSTEEDALPLLLNKTMAAGKKAVVSSRASSMANLSSAVWSFGHMASGRKGITYGGDGSWLPHGIAGKDDDDAALCPIWFSGDTEKNLNNAEFGFFLDGQEPSSMLESNEQLDRIFILFNGLDDNAVTRARVQWKSLRDQGHDLSYWTQDDSGKWQKTA